MFSGGWYSTAEGRYKVTAKGANVDVIFEPSTGFIGTTQGINIRRVDTNGASTDWIAKNNEEKSWICLSLMLKSI